MLKPMLASTKKIKKEDDFNLTSSDRPLSSAESHKSPPPRLTETPKSTHNGSRLTDTPKGVLPPPSALRLILKFEGTSADNNDSPAVTQNNSNTHASNNIVLTQEPSEDSHNASSMTPKKEKKRKRDREHSKKHKEKKHKKDSNHPESMYIVLDSSEAPVVKDQPNKPETAAERERRLSVPLRQRHNRTPLQRLLDYAIQQLEDKDVLQVFAWPVTDQIAPGYSKMIKNPMDFSTMRQKIEENAYPNLNSFTSDFQLMCNNAMMYNRPDTMYYKAAKRLLHSGIKFLSVDKLRNLANSFPLIKQIPPEQLGFDWETGSPVEVISNADDNEKDNGKKRCHGELTPEQALELAKKSACTYDERQFLKRRKTTFSMGFLRQRQDGSTSLAIFVPGEGVDPERPGERVVTLGQLVGKLNQGSGALQGFREHRRNIAKAVKPLSYGPFGSYAPSYDSTFANLSKEESDLVYGTYGEENPRHIDDVLNLAKVCDYTLVMVDNLLDLMSGGEYRKSKNVIDEQKKFQEEEERVRELIESKSNSANNSQGDSSSIKIEFEQLKTLSDLGIDTSFLGQFEEISTNLNPVQAKLDSTAQLIEKLHQVQNERLSAPPPSHLSQILHPSELEVQLAEKVVDNLSTITKQVPPGAIIPVPSIRKAMGVVSDTVEGSLNNTLDGVITLFSGEEVRNNTGTIELDSDLEPGSSSCNISNKSVEEMLMD